MAINSVPRTAGTGAPVAEAAPGERKGLASVATDPAFAALLVGLIGVPAPVAAAQPAVEGQAPGPATEALPQAVESFLQAQRVQTPAVVATVTAEAQPAQTPLLMVPQPAPAQAQVDASPVPAQMPVEPQLPAAFQMPVEPPVPKQQLVSQPLTLPNPVAVTPEVKSVKVLMEAPAQVALSVQSIAPDELEPAAPADYAVVPEVPVESVFVSFAPVQTGETTPLSGSARTEGPAPIPSPIDPQQLMEAVAKSAASGKDGQYTVTLRLHPEQLGEVRLQLHLNGSEVRTMMEVATPAARQALEQSSDLLRQGLGQSGLTLSGFQVSTGQGERKRDQEWPDDTRPDRRRTTAAAEAPRTGAAPAPGMRRPAGTGFDTLA